MLISFSSKRQIGVFSVAEPEFVDEGAIEVNLDFAPDWTVVVFDKEIIADGINRV